MVYKSSAKPTFSINYTILLTQRLKHRLKVAVENSGTERYRDTTSASSSDKRIGRKKHLYNSKLI